MREATWGQIPRSFAGRGAWVRLDAWPALGLLGGASQTVAPELPYIIILHLLLLPRSRFSQLPLARSQQCTRTVLPMLSSPALISGAP